MITTWKADDGSIFFADGTWIRVGDRLKAEVVVSKHAAEVEARDEVITKLLDLTAPHVDEFGNRQWWQYKRPEQMHARACEIAGRTE